MSQGRYRFYREHKYVSYILTELERTIARADFRCNIEIQAIQSQFESLAHLMKGHADHEDQAIHELLRRKGSSVYDSIEAHHHVLEDQLKGLHQDLIKIKKSDDSELKISLGYQFFLNYRLFISHQYQHFHEEETVVMPELQRLYPDNELRTVDFHTYAIMTPEQMLHMTQLLFPQMNRSDHEAFINDMKDSQPGKLSEIADQLLT